MPSLIAQTGPAAKIVLLILLSFSVISWAIIYVKWQTFKEAKEQGDKFLRAFRKSRSLPELNTAIENFPINPLRAIFEAGFREMAAQAGNPGGGVKNIRSLERALQIAASEQLSVLEQKLSWLATTGSVTPFIGLFGTVWGIMGAFLSLGSSGAASLRVVGPGIAEALVATAAGLFAAIPAVIAYNYFLSRIKEFGKIMDSFALEFLNAAERNST
ncbi:MAG: protein TolQ [Acidobacteria bacterium RIFCSPLOWO2_12_FULL_54_10]|nr:MAG: protein TolQ [Acidobacteria bacterium RIFCSPLOWO2_12_FULL_54_10]